MGLMPLKQVVTINRKGAVDRWGNETTPTTSFMLNCRVDEKAKLSRHVSKQAGTAQTLAEEVVGEAKIYFDKFADIQLTDEIVYTDESGATKTYYPQTIERVRGITSKVLLTVVDV